LVIKKHILIVFFVLFASVNYGQEENPSTPEVDSLKTDLKAEGLVVIDSLVKKKRAINPLAPSKAAFYSVVLPGLGQVYNKRYWKVPIVWGAIGAGIYGYTFYDNSYKKLRTAFKRRKAGFLIDDPDIAETVTDDQLERLQNDRQNDRDLTLLITIMLYALNVVDANVDAHLKQFNIDDDLSFDMELHPYIDVNPITTDPNYGMALTIKF
jgi:hypothetical protein